MSSENMLGGYEIIERIGAGGMATVYRAHQAKLERDVAVKLMHANIAADPGFIARFEREARIVARLDHPNIVPLYDYDDYEGQPYLVMKFVDGRTLKNLLRDGPMPPEEVVRIISALGDALQYAHESGVLHRDVKPSNVLISKRGTPYLTDFGLARIARQGESTMSADVMLGTPHYISPEQARGNNDLDERTDVYSLGIVLYELVTGRVPFIGDTSYAIIHDQIYSAPPLPSSINEDIPGTVEDVLMKALAKDRDQRYATPLELVDAYREAVAGQHIAAPESQVAPREQTPPPEPVDTGPAGSMINRFFQGVETFGKNMEGQFSDFEEYAKGMDDDEKRREATRRFKEAWKATRRGDRDEQRSERRKRKFGEGFGKPPRSATISISAGKDKDSDDDDDSGAYQYDPSLPPEENIRRRLEWRHKRRREKFGEWIGHVFSFFIITWIFCGLPQVIQAISEGASLPLGFLNIILYLWAFGLLMHTLGTWGEFGPGYLRRQRNLDREVASQMQQLYGTSASTPAKSKRKNALSDSPDVRLSSDGEFTESFLDEVDHTDRRR